jgi:hypothetical protein
MAAAVQGFSTQPVFAGEISGRPSLSSAVRSASMREPICWAALASARWLRSLRVRSRESV